MSSANQPPATLPKIEGDSEIQFDVLTHKSVRHAGPPDPAAVEEYGDVSRLSYLGRQAFRSAISLALFRKQPQLSVHELADCETKMLEHSQIAKLARYYGLPRKIRYAPGVQIDDPEELAYVFFAWFGAVFLRSGMYPIDTFVTGLIDPTAKPPAPPQPAPKPEPVTPPLSFNNDPYQQYPQQYHPSAPHFHSSSSFSPPPQQPAPPQPLSQPPPLPPGHYQPRVSLALFNERASQVGYMVSYPATMSGPPHAPTWVVHCCVNGIEKGLGQGRSQKIAKEQAAQQAWVAMGWS